MVCIPMQRKVGGRLNRAWRGKPRLAGCMVCVRTNARTLDTRPKYDRNHFLYSSVLGDPEVTANVIVKLRIRIGQVVDLKYIYSLTSGSMIRFSRETVLNIKLSVFR